MKLTIRNIVEIAMLVALAILLDLPFLKIRIGQNGGSISLTMVPLVILSIRQGPIKGFVGCGIVYGFLTCVLDGWGLMYFPFDYLLGYGSICIVGLFKNKLFIKDHISKSILWLTIGIILAFVGRLISSSLSSIIFYEFNVLEALVYNLLYLVPSTVLTLDCVLLLYKPLEIVNKRFPVKSI